MRKMLQHSYSMQGEISFQTKVIKIGNSVGIILPKPLCRAMNLKVGDLVDMSLGPNKRIIVRKANRKEIADWLKKNSQVSSH